MPSSARATRGTINATILIIGEHFTADEKTKLPFSGQAGREFDRMLFEAGIFTTSCLFTNLSQATTSFTSPHPFLFPNAEKKLRAKFRGVYATPAFCEDLSSLEELIIKLNPQLIIGCGNWALWALTDLATISTSAGYSLPGGVMKWRGSELQTRPLGPTGKTFPFLPIVSPSTILRSWDLRHLTIHDLKARASLFLKGKKTWGEKASTFLPNPTYLQTLTILNDWLVRAELSETSLSVDIETTQRKFITCLGIADATQAICIPFFWTDENGKSTDYFTTEEESNLWLKLQQLLTHPNIRIIGQNFSYDATFISRMLGIHLTVDFDTMLAHHLCWPGTPKSLDHLASLYVDNYIYWKDESQEWASASDHLSNWTYNCKDTRYTYDIAIELKQLLSKLNLNELYKDRLDQWKLSQQMARKGILANQPSRAAMRQELQEAFEVYQNFLLECMPQELRLTPTGKPWFNSPTFSMDIFYSQLGIQPVLHKKTKKSTLNVTSFETLKKRAPWATPIFDSLEKIRSIGVFISHFLDMPLSPDGRIRTSFNIAGTDTFRWSSSSNPFGEGTNLQNIPKGD